MAVIGGLMFTGWLFALASGPETYAWYTGLLTTIPGYIVMVGLSWAFFQHMSSGLRHFVLDVGAGYEVEANNRWAAFLPLLGVLLTAAFWAAVVLL